MNDVTTPLPTLPEAIESAIAEGDLSKLSSPERIAYYKKKCDSVGLNYVSQPFQYLELNNKLVLYATKACTDQLRQLHKISITITAQERIGDIYVVRAKAMTPDGREDEDMGTAYLKKEEITGWEVNQKTGKKYPKKSGKWIDLVGDDLANAMLKSITKAKRRVTLSIVGLGMLDESEVETIKGAKEVTEAPAEKTLHQFLEEGSHAGDYVIPIGTHKGRKIKDFSKPELGEMFTNAIASLEVPDLSETQKVLLNEAIGHMKEYLSGK